MVNYNKSCGFVFMLNLQHIIRVYKKISLLFRCVKKILYIKQTLCSICANKTSLTLKRKPDVDQERMFQSGQNFHLSKDILQCISFDTLRLIHILHSKHLFCVLFLYDTNLQRDYVTVKYQHNVVEYSISMYCFKKKI